VDKELFFPYYAQRMLCKMQLHRNHNELTKYVCNMGYYVNIFHLAILYTRDDNMDKDELRQALDGLGWKQSELARKLGVTTSTVSRWATGEPIPVWLAEYLRVMQELDRLHRMFVRPPKPVRETAPVETSAPRTETRAAAMVRTLAETNFGEV
jgi:transcriptional regulator with XRE-family HTH domain